VSDGGGIYCRDCGYDLRATESGPCPECGTVFSRSDYRTFARGQADVWPPYEFKFLLIPEGFILSMWIAVVVFTWTGILTLQNSVAGVFLSISCLGLFVHGFLMVYGLIAMIIGLRRVSSDRRLLYTLVMLSPWWVSACMYGLTVMMAR